MMLINKYNINLKNDLNRIKININFEKKIIYKNIFIIL